MEGSEKASLLVIGEEGGARGTLCGWLRRTGYPVHATGLDENLDATRGVRPDVVLHVWASPGSEAMRYCQRVKADPDLRDTWVVLLSRTSVGHELVRGLDAGGDDFLSEPMTDAELFARIRAGMRVRLAQRESARGARHAAVRELAAAVGHEINNPLTGLCGHLELVRRHVEREDAPQALHHAERAGDLVWRIADVVARLVALDHVTTTTYIDAVRMIDLAAPAGGSSRSAP
jgi:DNA-binding response OmpR family regulator